MVGLPLREFKWSYAPAPLAGSPLKSSSSVAQRRTLCRVVAIDAVIARSVRHHWVDSGNTLRSKMLCCPNPGEQGSDGQEPSY
jgi:hypothetical protein